ncbi:MAG TPA: phosphate ABC transporter permease PstA [Nitrospiria bacterium]|jgi:phosphate transport system permease protein
MRRFKTFFFSLVCCVSAFFSISFLFLILSVIVIKGGSAIHWEFLTQPSRSIGQEGGITYQILGTLLLIFGAGLISLPVALGAVIYETEYLKPPFQKAANILIFSLNGVPTILFGLVGFLIFGLYLRWGISWASGCVILGVMILPTLVISIKEGIQTIPLIYREAALALGMTKAQVIRKVVIPQSFHGWVTGLLLGLGRAAGETAAILFTATAFSGVTLPQSFIEPVSTLQTHLFVLSQEGVGSVSLTHAWGTALVLLFNLSSLAVRFKLTWEGER